MRYGCAHSRGLLVGVLLSFALVWKWSNSVVERLPADEHGDFAVVRC
jgi:hypothetical protein